MDNFGPRAGSKQQLLDKANIMGHPSFPRAVHEYARGAVSIHVDFAQMRRYNTDSGAFLLLLTMFLLEHSADGLTANRLKAVCKFAGICSEGRTAAFLAYMRGRKDLVTAAAQINRRERRLEFSTTMTTYFGTRLSISLQTARDFGAEVPGVIAGLGDKQFLAEFLRVSSAQLAGNFNIRSPFTKMIETFADHSGGMQFLYSLVASDIDILRGAALKISLKKSARDLGVSRAHLLALLEAGNSKFYLIWDPQARTVVFTETLSRGITDLLAGIFAVLVRCARDTMRLSQAAAT